MQYGILEYLERQLATFDEVPFGAVDAALLSQACMLDAPWAVPAIPAGDQRRHVLDKLFAHGGRPRGAHFRDLARAERFDTLLCGFTPTELKRELFGLIASPRFRDLALCDYLSVFDEASHTQFAAMTFIWRDEFAYVGFRGTDTSFAGWRENFDMAYREPVRAQALAATYLDAVADHLPERLFVGGHSKGGNVALFAAAMCREDVRARIERVWCHDAPGFRAGSSVLERAAHLAERIHMTVPQDSLVGMLMDVPVTPQVVHSDAFGGIDQHSLFTWEVAGDDFAYVERVADASRTVHDAINEWLAAMEPRDVERVVEALFAAAAASGAADARAFLRLGPDTLKSVREAARRIDDASREILSQALGDLAAIAVRRAGRDVAAALFGE